MSGTDTTSTRRWRACCICASRSPPKLSRSQRRHLRSGQRDHGGARRHRRDFCAVMACVRPGDEVIVFDPCYDSYEPAIALAGGRAVHIPLTPHSFSIDWQRVEAAITPRTRLIMVNSPHNPSGATLSRRGSAATAGPGGAARPAGHQRRGVRASGVRRPAAPQRAAVSRAAPAQLRAVLLRQDLQRHRLEDRLLRRASAPDRGVAQGAPVRVFRRDPGAVGGGRLHAERRSTAASCRRSTSASATCSARLLADSVRSHPAPAPISSCSTTARSATRHDVELAALDPPARRRRHPDFHFLRGTAGALPAFLLRQERDHADAAGARLRSAVEESTARHPGPVRAGLGAARRQPAPGWPSMSARLAGTPTSSCCRRCSPPASR